MSRNGKQDSGPRVDVALVHYPVVNRNGETIGSAVTNLDLHGEAYTDANAWNTYHHKGLSVTPIGAVGEKALRATEDPAQGRWLYFVTVDKNGTTLFANTFEQHKRNREVACRNRFLTTGCE